jgi:hypothetical protein
MGCGCSASSSGGRVSSALLYQAPTITPLVDCTYTVEQLQNWLVQIDCFVSKGLLSTTPTITQRKVNMYIGITLSAINYASNPCYFKSQLDEVQSFIIIITSTGQC